MSPMTFDIVVTHDKSKWCSSRESSVIDLLFNAINADDKDRVASMLGGANRTIKSLQARGVLTVSRPPK